MRNQIKDALEPVLHSSKANSETVIAIRERLEDLATRVETAKNRIKQEEAPKIAERRDTHRDSFSGTSSTCGPIVGETQRELANVRKFCEAVPDGVAVGAYAVGPLLWVKVSRPMAEQMQQDRLSTENAVLAWMGIWKQLSGSLAVTVTVEWEAVEIAKGDTTLFGGDKVTVR